MRLEKFVFCGAFVIAVVDVLVRDYLSMGFMVLTMISMAILLRRSPTPRQPTHREDKQNTHHK